MGHAAMSSIFGKQIRYPQHTLLTLVVYPGHTNAAARSVVTMPLDSDMPAFATKMDVTSTLTARAIHHFSGHPNLSIQPRL